MELQAVSESGLGGKVATPTERAPSIFRCWGLPCHSFYRQHAIRRPLWMETE